MENFIDTWKKVITSPSEFYENMPKEGGFGEPLIFAAINFIVLGIGSAMVGIVLGSFGFALLGGDAGATFVSMIINVISNVIFTPIFGIIWLFIVGAVLFILFKIVGGSGSYEGTFRIVAYSSAVSLLAWIPIAGWLFGLYQIILNIIGGKYVHNLSTTRSAIAVLIPYILILGIVILIIGAAVIAAFVFGMGGSLQP